MPIVKNDTSNIYKPRKGVNWYFKILTFLDNSWKRFQSSSDALIN